MHQVILSLFRCNEKSSFSSVLLGLDDGVADVLSKIQPVLHPTGRPGITVNRQLTANSRGERLG